MARPLFLTIAAVCIVTLAIALFMLFGRGTLAEESMRVGGSTVQFRITETHGNLYVSAREAKTWSLGWSSAMLIGKASEVGTANPTINVDEKQGRVLFRVGNVATEFDLASRAFAPARPAERQGTADP